MLIVEDHDPMRWMLRELPPTMERALRPMQSHPPLRARAEIVRAH